MNLEEEYFRILKEWINKDEKITIKVTGEVRQGMSCNAMSLCYNLDGGERK